MSTRKMSPIMVGISAMLSSIYPDAKLFSAASNMHEDDYTETITLHVDLFSIMVIEWHYLRSMTKTLKDISIQLTLYKIDKSPHQQMLERTNGTQGWDGKLPVDETGDIDRTFFKKLIENHDCW